MRVKILLFLTIGFALGFSSCRKKKESLKSCNGDVIISQDEFMSAPDDPVTIESLKLDDGCLKVKFSASGCNGKSWKVKLIDVGTIAKSNPPQRMLRLSLDNEELCEAWITTELSFNIQSLKVPDSKSVQLHVSDKYILYEY